MHLAKVFTPIHTERLVLREIVASDLASIFKGLSHPDIIRYYGIHFDTLEATREQMHWFAALVKEERGIWWAVCDRETRDFLGAGGFNDWNKEHRRAEIGFWLLPEAWGKGFMKEAMEKICDFGFSQMGLQRIEGFVETENTNCQKGLAKLDFDLEGTMRDYELKNGKWIDVSIYAKLAR